MTLWCIGLTGLCTVAGLGTLRGCPQVSVIEFDVGGHGVRDAEMHIG